MKYLICSDIHGADRPARVLSDFFIKLKCDKIILLGDVLYHGPRNVLPQAHNPKGVIQILNNLSEKILACRGNCEAEVDQMVLNFPLFSDYVLLSEGGRRIFATHGHLWAPPPCRSLHGTLPALSAGDIFLFGHTHVSCLEKNQDGIVICNPGSPALPKDGSEAGFAVLSFTPDFIELYNLEGTVIKKLEF